MKPIAKLFPGQQTDDNSGVRRINRGNKTIEETRQGYADVIESMERHELLGPLVRGGFHNGVRQEGLLRRLIYKLNAELYDRRLLKESEYHNQDAALRSLEHIFETTMKDVIALWARLSAQKVEWNELCAVLEDYFYDLASLFGVEQQMRFFTRNWFDTYARNELNASALASYQQLSYLGASGSVEDQQKIAKEIRGNITSINNKLRNLPIKPEHYPAFSKLNPQSKVLIQPGNPSSPNPHHLVVSMKHGRGETAKTETYPSPWVEPPFLPKPAEQKKSWWGKLWGKLTGK